MNLIYLIPLATVFIAVVAFIFIIREIRRKGPNPKNVTWPDYEDTLRALYAATAKHYGDKVADDVFQVSIIVLERRSGDPSGLYYPGQRLITIYKNEDRAIDSALAHELFCHRLPHVTESNINYEHADKWEQVRINLTREAGHILTHKLAA